MAIYRLSAQVVSRKMGQAVTASAAYRSGARLRDDRTGASFDYSRRSGVVHAEILAPEATPGWMLDREALWNAVEAVEKRKDAQLARELQLALPHELTPEARLQLVREFVQRECVERGMVADVAIHAPHRAGDTRNAHAHVLLTMRSLTGAGFGPKERDWNAKELLETWRETWARDVNLALERAGLEARVDHRSLEAQRAEAEQAAEQAQERGDQAAAEREAARAGALEREPEPKIGPAANALERRGIETERGQLHREVLARNEDRQRLRAVLREAEKRLAAIRDRLLAVMSEQRHNLAGLWERLEQAFRRSREVQPKTSREAVRDIPRTGSGTADRDRLMGRSGQRTREPESGHPSIDRLLGRGERSGEAPRPLRTRRRDEPDRDR